MEIAVELREREGRSNDPNDHFDQVWCVFDIDVHPKVPDARQQARDQKIDLIVSNPCFDLWILLHYQDQSAHIHRHAARKACRKHIPGYDKAPPCEELLGLFEEAERRAIDLLRRHAKAGEEGANPSTTVHLLVRQLRNYSQRP